MVITTKYNIGDVVYFIDRTLNYKGDVIRDKGVQPTTIKQIIVLEYDYMYVTENGNFSECDLFVTEQQAKDWLKTVEDYLNDR